MIKPEELRIGHPQFNIKIEHVHHIQNLVRDLTGKELKAIKP